MFVKIESIKSSQGREICLYGLDVNAKSPNLFVFGMFHGDEPEGGYIIERFMEELEKKTNIKSGFNLYLIPCLNPDGKALQIRENSNKVDLNRNYPTDNFLPESVNPHSGKASAGSPASEIETQWVISLIEKFKPERILSIHSDLHLVDYDGPAKELAVKMSRLCGYKLVENVGYPTTGSFGTWAGIERKIPLITLETWRARDQKDLEKIWSELRTAIYDFCLISD